jgi:hypothetical protein
MFLTRCVFIKAFFLISWLWIQVAVRPVEGFLVGQQTTCGKEKSGTTTITRKISSGLTFENGDQILVSVQKPMGIVLEQDSEESVIRIAEVDPNGSGAASGLKVGDVLLAVQNADMGDRDLDYAMQFITHAPKVLNLRFARPLD